MICSDSLSALLGLSDALSSDRLVQMVQATLHSLAANEKVVVFVWIPSHIGIEGNDLADQAARQAADSESSDRIPSRPEDVKSFLTSKGLEMWQNEWDNSLSKLGEGKRSVAPRHTTGRLKRREEVILTRVRIGLNRQHQC